MRKITILLLMLGFGFSGHAQLIKIGLRAGVGSAHYSFDQLTYINELTTTVLQVNPQGAGFAFNVGAMGRVNIPILPLSARIGAQYSSLQSKVAIFDHTDNTNTIINETNSRFDIPMQLTLNLTKFRIIGGVGHSFDIGRSSKTVDYLTENYVNTDRFDFTVESPTMNYWTFNFGLGLEMKKWAIDVIVEGPMDEQIKAEGSDKFIFGPNPGQVTANFTYFLF